MSSQCFRNAVVEFDFFNTSSKCCNEAHTHTLCLATAEQSNCVLNQLPVGQFQNEELHHRPSHKLNLDIPIQLKQCMPRGSCYPGKCQPRMRLKSLNAKSSGTAASSAASTAILHRPHLQVLGRLSLALPRTSDTAA